MSFVSGFDAALWAPSAVCGREKEIQLRASAARIKTTNSRRSASELLRNGPAGGAHQGGVGFNQRGRICAA